MKILQGVGDGRFWLYVGFLFRLRYVHKHICSVVRKFIFIHGVYMACMTNIFMQVSYYICARNKYRQGRSGGTLIRLCTHSRCSARARARACMCGQQTRGNQEVQTTSRSVQTTSGMPGFGFEYEQLHQIIYSMFHEMILGACMLLEAVTTNSDVCAHSHRFSLILKAFVFSTFN